MIFCEECGAENSESALFCSSCGYKKKDNINTDGDFLLTRMKFSQVFGWALLVGIFSPLSVNLIKLIKIQSPFLDHLVYEAAISSILVGTISWLLLGKKHVIRNSCVSIVVSIIWIAIYRKLVFPVCFEGIDWNNATVFIKGLRSSLSTGTIVGISFAISALMMKKRRWVFYFIGIGVICSYFVSVTIDKLVFEEALKYSNNIKALGGSEPSLSEEIIRYLRRVSFRTLYILVFVYVSQKLREWYIRNFLFDQDHVC